MRVRLRTFFVCTATAFALLMPSATTSHASTEVVFSFTGANQFWVVPEGVTSVRVDMVGAGGAGGQNVGDRLAVGGGGGYVTGVLIVTPGDTLTLIVGQNGINNNVSEPRDNNYRFGGGGSGAGNTASFPDTWGSGGGRSAIRSSNAFYGVGGTDDLLTAGGGGGGGFSLVRGAGGAGGGDVGQAGGRGDAIQAAGGGTQDAGGLAGGCFGPPPASTNCENGTAGIRYAGGFAQLSGGNSEGGGGGGGYFGGGAAGDNGGGGGGSSFLGSAAYFDGESTAGNGRDAGATTWPAACGVNPGQGALPGRSPAEPEHVSGNGCIVITYSTSGPPPPSTVSSAAGSTGLTLTFASDSRIRCFPHSVSSEVSSWVRVPSRVQCTITAESSSPILLGWATTQDFPVSLAQRQVDNGWGAYELTDSGGQLTSVFIPAGGSAYLYVSNTVYPILSSVSNSAIDA